MDLIKKVWSIRIVRFLVVGGINTIFGYSIYTILIKLNVHYSLSLLIGHILGILFNFNTTARIVFNSKDYRLLIRFFAVYGTTYVINLGALRIFKSINFNMIFAQMIMILPMALLSFFLNKKLVFN